MIDADEAADTFYREIREGGCGWVAYQNGNYVAFPDNENRLMVPMWSRRALCDRFLESNCPSMAIRPVEVPIEVLLGTQLAMIDALGGEVGLNPTDDVPKTVVVTTAELRAGLSQ